MNDPTNIDVNAERLHIAWGDGLAREFAAAELRGLCQCANCVSEVTGELLLDRKTISSDIRITAAEPVGRYAVGLVFSDFHKTGIYAFDFLRRVAEGR